MSIFKALVVDPDLEGEFRSIVKAHQHSTGTVDDDAQGIGKSVAGNTTKIHIAVESNGMPIEFEITGGQLKRNYKSMLVLACSYLWLPLCIVNTP